MRPLTIPLLLALVLATACGNSTIDGETRGEAAETVPGRWYTRAQVDAGLPLYRANCASCHGVDGSATEDWRKTDANGNYPPPPLNGTAHTWHHPLEVLTETIALGGAPYDGLMPAFGHVIDPEGQLAIVAYIQSWWTDEVYARWDEINSR
jgi:mono/diheme cytochrome c family protein